MSESEPLNVPPAVTATDKLNTIFQKPGPYVTVYMYIDLMEKDSTADLYERWLDLRKMVEETASPEALKAIEARLKLPRPEDVAGIAVIAATDGSTVVDYGMEPPKADVISVKPLPYCGPLLEWQQRRVPHLVVTVDSTGGDIVTFGPNNFSQVDTYQEPLSALVSHISNHAKAVEAKLVVLSGEAKLLKQLANALATELPIECRVIKNSEDKTVQELTDATVRYVGDAVARKTKEYLAEERFLTQHDAAEQGVAETVKTLSDGEAEVLLVHDDPDDDRMIWVGQLPFQLSLEQRPESVVQTRMVDALIASALIQDITIRVIPSTGDQGPDDDVAALTRTPDTPTSF